MTYFHYLLTRKEDEMLYTFFRTQMYNPTPGDWMEQAKIDFKDFDIPCDFEFLRSKSKESFKKIVKTKANEYSLEYLTQKQQKHSKMNNLFYTEMKMQDYFKTPGITTDEVCNLFKWRVRMASLGENFRGNQANVVCPLFQNHLDNQPMAFKCGKMKNEISMNMEIEDIYKKEIPLEIAQELLKIQNVREKLLEK